eukprot:4658965-Prymnesium_polylepis.1
MRRHCTPKHLDSQRDALSPPNGRPAHASPHTRTSWHPGCWTGGSIERERERRNARCAECQRVLVEVDLRVVPRGVVIREDGVAVGRLRVRWRVAHLWRYQGHAWMRGKLHHLATCIDERPLPVVLESSRARVDAPPIHLHRAAALDRIDEDGCKSRRLRLGRHLGWNAGGARSGCAAGAKARANRWLHLIIVGVDEGVREEAHEGVD